MEELLLSLQELRSRMSIALHYLHSRLSECLDNLDDVNEEKGERFHQDITNRWRNVTKIDGTAT